MEEVLLELLSNKHLERLFKFELANREFFKSVGLERKDNYYNKKTFEIIYGEYLYGMEKDLFYMYLIVKDKRIIGRINIVEVDRKNSIGEIGYRMDKNEQGKGYATEGLKQILIKMKDLHKLKKARAVILVDNKSSERVLLKNGFTREEEKDLIEVDGRYYDGLRYIKQL